MQRCARQRYAPISAWPIRACCALAICCCYFGLVAAQDKSAFTPWQPTFVGDAWGEPLLFPEIPNDLPPITVAPDHSAADTAPRYDAQLVGHQEPLPRPEAPPEPVPPGAAYPLQPVPSGLLIPEPSCLTCNGCGTCGGCVTCEPCVAHTRWGRFACGLYNAVCCPDPCYEPRWTGVANAAYWVDSARPVTHVRYRWDASLDMIYPDRATYYWPTVGTLGPAVAPNTLDLHELSMYNEVAHDGFGFFINTPYRSWDTEAGAHAAGMGDLDMGTKSVLFDCELMQVTFQFRTFVPLGNPLKGIGTGHVTLEPSLLIGLNIAPDTYLQAQLSEWIPIAAPGGAGAILHYHASLNQVVWRWQPAVPIIATFEANGWSFQDGSFTDATGTVYTASGETYLSAGPGFRIVVCDKVDFGIGTAFALTDEHWGEQSIRSEFRWRF